MRKRIFQVKAMLNTKEYAHLEKQLAASGLNKSEFLRDLIMKTEIHPKPSEEIHEILRLISNIANNTNQIAKVANTSGYINPEEIKGLLIMVDKCWFMIKEIS